MSGIHGRTTPQATLVPDHGPQVAWRADGERLHLQHGPIDLIIECEGTPDACAAAYQAAIDRFDGLLVDLVTELDLLRTPLTPGALPSPVGTVAARMVEAGGRHCEDEIVTPMVAVAGSVADEVGAAMSAAASLDRWMVNNGGDIAFGLEPGRHYRIGLVVDPRRATVASAPVESAVVIAADPGIGGVATSGRHGRSLSLGIADAVTVFAPTAAGADAAATVIANRVDIGPHTEVMRRPARELDPDSDLGGRPVTVDVGVLSVDEVRNALGNGLGYAESCVGRGLISGAVLHLAGVEVATASLSFALAAASASATTDRASVAAAVQDALP